MPESGNNPETVIRKCDCRIAAENRINTTSENNPAKDCRIAGFPSVKHFD
jgi:hypothetical protein